MGRPKAEVTLGRRVLTDAMHQTRDFFDTLTPDEQLLALNIIQDLMESGGNSIKYDALWEIDYKTKPVDIDTFITDPYYAGGVASNLYPHWRDDLNIVFAPGARYHEWIFGGAIGTGKTTVACLAKMYVIYRMSCLRNPQPYYGLLPTSTIVFGVYSVTKTQVHEVGYGKLRGYLDASPYFQEQFPYNPRLLQQVNFLSANMKVMAGTRDYHALGLDVFSFLMDEANFMKAGKRKKDKVTEMGQAYKIYNAAKTRLKSRYMRPGGYVPGMVFLVSSKQSRTSFLEDHIKSVRDEIDAGEVYVSDYALYEVKQRANIEARKKDPHISPLYVRKKFRVEVGDRIFPSRILEEDDYPREGAEVIEVPGEFLSDFVRDIDQALRDIAGIATFGISPLIRHKKSIHDCITEDYQHPFARTEVPLSTTDDGTIDEYFLPEHLFAVKRSHYSPLLNPAVPRFGHIDIAFTQDCCGLAFGHVSGFKSVRRVRPDGTFHQVKTPMIHIDMMLRIVPPLHGEIDLGKIRAFIQSISDMGMPIARITCDGYQSRDMMQVLRKIGYESGLLSVDRDDGPYLHVRGAITEKRITYYRYEPFLTEMENLERDMDAHKVDHPDKNPDGTTGSKDVSDCVAGVVYSCVTDARVDSELSPAADKAGDLPTYRERMEELNWDAIQQELK